MWARTTLLWGFLSLALVSCLAGRALAELMTAFVGLEMSSISTYILAGFRRDSLRSNESAMKYFLLSIFSSAFLLFGFSYLYGITGTTNLAALTTARDRAVGDSVPLVFG